MVKAFAIYGNPDCLSRDLYATEYVGRKTHEDGSTIIVVRGSDISGRCGIFVPISVFPSKKSAFLQSGRDARRREAL